jgi:hypothetical protein
MSERRLLRPGNRWFFTIAEFTPTTRVSHSASEVELTTPRATIVMR